VRGPICIIVLASVLLNAGTAMADEDKDLDLIPKAAQQPASSSPEAPRASASAHRLYLENAFSLSWLGDGLLVPSPPPKPARWQERLFVDLRDEWSLGSRVRLFYSGRLNFRAEDDLSDLDHENLVNDFREGYASWELLDRTYLDVGRINVKSGVAIGFNPTDFFKTRAVVEPLSADPAVLREDRLGALMLRAQHIWHGGSLVAAFAPGLYDPSPLYTDVHLPSFDPMLDRTNAHDRLLLKGSVDIGLDLNPEFIFYREGSQTRWGINVTQSIGQSVVAYVEWSGGRRSSLIDDALGYGRMTRTLPANGPSVLPEDSDRSFQNEVAIGGSYTTENKITLNLEYHFNQAGFSRRDWNDWFLAGRGSTDLSPSARELWFIRAYARDQQEPITQHSVFLRADWVDAFVPKLELTGFIDADSLDGSGTIQLAADYYLSNAWTVGGLVSANFGNRHSNFGSLPQAESLLLKVVRYL